MNRQLFVMALVALSTLSAAVAHAQPSPGELGFKRVATPKEPDAIALYADAPAKPASVERWDGVVVRGVEIGDRVVRNVTRPTLTPFLPKPERATGAAVIVAPGGGFAMLSIDLEGYAVARWCAEHGIAAFVLKYRVNQTPDDEAEFQREMGALANAKGAPPPAFEPRAIEDAAQTLKLVRAGAERWHVDPKRVGMIGFSAGAMVTLQSALAKDSAARPAFAGVIYGPLTAVTVPADAPPLFVATALDDAMSGRNNGFGLIESWHKAQRPVEFHAYETGGHGFGIGRPGTTSAPMIDQFYGWLQIHQIVPSRK